ncbi:MAG: FliH/SctL family protein [Candidatus Eremiobacteraeota bacterium]|nr:FliH/SctL family protein [Candidatus Eremiobacteraeota bacterium]
MGLIKQHKITTEGAADKAPPSGLSPAKSGILKGGTYSTFTPPGVADDASSASPAGIEEPKPAVAQPQAPQKAREPVKDEEATPLIEEAPVEPPPPPPPQPQMDKIIIEEAEKKAEEIIKKARAEAKKLIEETKLYSQSAFSQAERDGLQKGKEDGFEAGREEMSNLIREAKNVLEQAMKERELLLRSIEPEVAKLAIRIAEKIIKLQLETDPEIVVSMIRAALETVKQRDEVIIKVNQEDYEYAKGKKDIFACMVEGLKTLDIIVDPGVDRGGCIIETNLGNADARIVTQIHTLELAFEKVEKDKNDAAAGPVQN